jgi:thiamine-phosphate pyrophosphorylase
VVFRIYLVTDPSIADVPGAVERALGALPRGAAAVQLRDRRAGARDLLALAMRLGEACRAHGAALLVNDRIDVALAAGADGVHVRGDSASVAEARALGVRLVGVSTHTVAEVRAAAEGGADFVVFGPVFETPGKGAPLGTESLAAAAAHGIPVYALGGVGPDNAAACLRAGATGVAAIRSVLGATDPAAAARRLGEEVLG